MAELELNAKDIARSITVKVDASKALRSIRWRIKIAMPFLWIATRVIGCNFEVK